MKFLLIWWLLGWIGFFMYRNGSKNYFGSWAWTYADVFLNGLYTLSGPIQIVHALANFGTNCFKKKG